MKLLYEKYQVDIIGKHYLPRKNLVQIVKSYDIVPNHILMGKFVYTCLW